MALDAQGNVYITGYSVNPDNYADVVTLKYSSQGKRLWVRRYNSPAKRWDQGNAPAVDSQGYVYVIANSDINDNFTNNPAFVTIKYSPSGDRLWVRFYDSPVNGNDHPVALAIDPQDNVIVAGFSTGLSLSDNYLIMKYNSAGERLWLSRFTRRYATSNFRTVTVDQAGNIYVTPYSWGVDFATVKFNPDGKELWVARYNGPGNEDDIPAAIAVDGQGNVFVTGSSFTGLATYRDYVTIKYDANGKRLWLRRANGPGNQSDYPQDMKLDQQGNVYATGKFQVSSFPQDYDYATIKCDTFGNKVWLK